MSLVPVLTLAVARTEPLVAAAASSLAAFDAGGAQSMPVAPSQLVVLQLLASAADRRTDYSTLHRLLGELTTGSRRSLALPTVSTSPEALAAAAAALAGIAKSEPEVTHEVAQTLLTASIESPRDDRAVAIVEDSFHALPADGPTEAAWVSDVGELTYGYRVMLAASDAVHGLRVYGPRDGTGEVFDALIRAAAPATHGRRLLAPAEVIEVGRAARVATARRHGWEPMFDLAQEERGCSAATADAFVIDGWLYDPSIPAHLVDATASTDDPDLLFHLTTAREPYAYRVASNLGHGRCRVVSPLAQESNGAQLWAAADSPDTWQYPPWGSPQWTREYDDALVRADSVVHALHRMVGLLDADTAVEAELQMAVAASAMNLLRFE